MNYQELLDTQNVLDQRIINDHNLHDKNLLDGKILALRVEVGELANETRCFKFWSVKPPSSREVILEEYVDGIHFLLSIALELKDRLTFPHSEIKALIAAEDLTEQFNEVFSGISRLSKLINCSAVSVESEFSELWSIYLGLGELLGFSEEEIEEYYVYKNQINHKRQDERY